MNGFTYDGISGGGNPPAGRPEMVENYSIRLTSCDFHLQNRKLLTYRLVKVAPLSGFEAMDAEMSEVVVDHETHPKEQINKTYLENKFIFEMQGAYSCHWGSFSWPTRTWW